MSTVDRHDFPACINCNRYFGRSEVRYWFGAGPSEVGPFCEKCDRTIKVHAGYTGEGTTSQPSEVRDE